VVRLEGIGLGVTSSYYRERVGVAPIVEKMVENRLRWFGHIERIPIDVVVRRVDQMEENTYCNLISITTAELIP